MHELSICQALLHQVADIVRERGAEAVECITIEVGPLCGTEPNLLLSAFQVMRSGKTATTHLSIKSCPVCIRCVLCGHESEAPADRLICLGCGAWQTRVVSGHELRLLRVQMRMPESTERRTLDPIEKGLGYV